MGPARLAASNPKALRMISRQLKTGLLSLLVLAGCAAPIPDLDYAFELYNSGLLNEARYEMGRWARLYPLSDDVEVVQLHILLIRRIKARETLALDQWQIGNTSVARKLARMTSFLHPVYSDSSAILVMIKTVESPKPRISKPIVSREVPKAAISDSIRVEASPYIWMLLDRQEELVIYLASAWEVVKHMESDTLVFRFEDLFGSAEVGRLLAATDSASRDLGQLQLENSLPNDEQDALNSILQQFIVEGQHGFGGSRNLAEFEFNGYKRDLIERILVIKSALGSRTDTN